MWPVRLAKAEAGAEVVDEVGLLLDGSKKRLVNLLLVLDTVLGGLLLLCTCQLNSGGRSVRKAHLRLLALLEESFLARFLRLLVLGEVAGLAGLLHHAVVHTSKIHLGRGRDNISGIDPSEGNTVDFERTGDEEDTLLEVLQDDDALATETTSEEDDDGAGSERRANLGRADGLASLR